MADKPWRVFVDTNVFIAGLLSSGGASAAVLDLGEAEEIQIVVGRQVLVEADRIFTEKFPDLLELFRLFLKSLSPLLLSDPDTGQVKKAAGMIDFDDAAILACAVQEPLDFLVTLDKKHFMTPKVRAFLSCPVMTPAEFLKKFRDEWSG